MRMLWLASAMALLAGCGPSPSAKPPGPTASDLRPGERLTTVSLAPYNWREHADCYRTPLASTVPINPSPDALKWRKARHFSGYLSTTFEGSNFVVARRDENTDTMDWDRYQSKIYYSDKDIAFAPEVREYWVEFVGREALCNSQSPDDHVFDTPSSPNLVIADHFDVIKRLR